MTRPRIARHPVAGYPVARRRIARRRVGAGLVELLVALVVLGIVSATALRSLMSQTRFADAQHKRRSARAVSRSPVNLIASEMRMVENVDGVAAASSASGASSITVRVPVVMGVVCGASGGGTALSLLPTDSVALASAALSGYAYLTTSSTYSYTETAIAQAFGGTAACTAASIATVPGGRVVVVTPALPAPAVAGTIAFLYQRVRYFFAPSATLTGRVGLWRTLEASNATEELAAPFDTTSRFRFFRNHNDTSDVAVPPIGEINGVELVLTGASERARQGRATPEVSSFRTALFFSNRRN